MKEAWETTQYATPLQKGLCDQGYLLAKVTMEEAAQSVLDDHRNPPHRHREYRGKEKDQYSPVLREGEFRECGGSS